MRCRVQGRVQGVFFRASTREQAHRLGITGHAINLADGSVEVVAYGPPAALAALRDWLWQGPPAARVSRLVCEDWQAQPEPEDFRIG
ncbi:MAG TPA: acylphosphatase [Gammaproteobacteria bacterium]|nr:acylphosphatase [Gammaproteobacteria bacterium]